MKVRPSLWILALMAVVPMAQATSLEKTHHLLPTTKTTKHHVKKASVQQGHPENVAHHNALLSAPTFPVVPPEVDHRLSSLEDTNKHLESTIEAISQRLNALGQTESEFEQEIAKSHRTEANTLMPLLAIIASGLFCGLLGFIGATLGRQSRILKSNSAKVEVTQSRLNPWAEAMPQSVNARLEPTLL